MSNWVSGLVRCTSEPDWPEIEGEPQVPWNWIATTDPLCYLMAERPRWDDQDPPNPLPLAILSDPAVVAAGGYQIGAWDMDGDPHGPIDEAAYNALLVRDSRKHVVLDPDTGDPVDSAPVDLGATDLRYPNFAGAAQRTFTDPQSDSRKLGDAQTHDRNRR